MLIKFEIKNFALLKHIIFEPSKGFTVLTGETGAGKSIIFDALGLLLGDRADAVLFENQTDKCILEGAFKLELPLVEMFFKQNDFDFEEQTILRREIAAGGKTRSFINDTPATLQQMKMLGSIILDIHSQHETLNIFKATNQLSILDSYAGNMSLLLTYKSKFDSFQSDLKLLKAHELKLAEIKKSESYNQFLLDELVQIDLTESDNELEQQIDQLSNSEEIKNAGALLNSVILDNENAIFDQLNQLQNEVKKLNNFFPKVEFNTRYQSLLLELKELARDANNEAEQVAVDDETLFNLEQRFNIIQQLLKKHQVQEISALIEIQHDLQSQSNNNEQLELEISKIKERISASKNDLQILSSQLHEIRMSTIPKLQDSILTLLHDLEMTKAKIHFKLNQIEDFTINGRDEISILFSANTDLAPMPLEKVASGGETSRLALCFKSLSNVSTSTLIFDEIDSGVSGRVAQKIGTLLKNIANNQQVIAITHSPQVASCAHTHLYTSKNEIEGKTTTQLEKLDHQSRINAIAQMLSGNQISDAAIENAKALLTSK